MIMCPHRRLRCSSCRRNTSRKWFVKIVGIPGGMGGVRENCCSAARDAGLAPVLNQSVSKLSTYSIVVPL